MKAVGLFFLVFLVSPGFGQLVWEFGTDAPSSRVVEHIKGSISLFEWNKEIPLRVPQCHRVSYVRVEVHNHLSTPMVTYNRHASVVTIAYKLLQNPLSSYSITVRGVPLRNCGDY